jgi:hypothetical protein
MSVGQPRPTRQNPNEEPYNPLQQPEGPPARDLNPPPHTPEQAPRGARPQPATQPVRRRDRKLCQHVKARSPLTREYVVPEVGLELHSNPGKERELRKTCGILSSPTGVRPTSTVKVWTLSTRPFAPEMCPTRQPGMAGPGIRRAMWMVPQRPPVMTCRRNGSRPLPRRTPELLMCRRGHTLPLVSPASGGRLL